MKTCLKPINPMGIYETLYAFKDACNVYMGDPGTHPWSQGFPLTSQLPEGPPLPESVSLTSTDLMYPKAWGNEDLREALAYYYNTFYDAGITTDNVMIFAGGRPGIFATLLLLDPEYKVLIEETEYTPYWDLLELLDKSYEMIPSNPENSFTPTASDYAAVLGDTPSFIVKSNPCNPTGIAWTGEDLKAMVKLAESEKCAALFDEAYEMFVDPAPESALAHIDDIDQTNIFISGAATKGLQAPGIRIGWVVASKENIEFLSNYSSFGMGGVSRPSQLYAAKLLDRDRIEHQRAAILSHYNMQRERYGEALQELGLELYTGKGGFYHWGRLPGELTAEEFNTKLFEHRAAILPGTLCDMFRRGNASPMAHFMRFSFGPLPVESFDEDVKILKQVLS